MVLESVLVSFFYKWLTRFTCSRDCLFSIVYSCLLGQRQGVHRCVDFSLGFLFCSIDLYFFSFLFFYFLIYISFFVPVPYCLDDCRFVVYSEVKQVDAFSFSLFLKIALAIRGFLQFQTNREIICSKSLKHAIGSLIGIAMNL